MISVEGSIDIIYPRSTTHLAQNVDGLIMGFIEEPTRSVSVGDRWVGERSGVIARLAPISPDLISQLDVRLWAPAIVNGVLTPKKKRATVIIRNVDTAPFAVPDDTERLTQDMDGRICSIVRTPSLRRPPIEVLRGKRRESWIDIAVEDAVVSNGVLSELVL